jgi:hypothetical protein
MRKLKGGSGKFKERGDSGDKEEYLSKTMETNTANNKK